MRTHRSMISPAMQSTLSEQRIADTRIRDSFRSKRLTVAVNIAIRSGHRGTKAADSTVSRLTCLTRRFRDGIPRQGRASSDVALDIHRTRSFCRQRSVALPSLGVIGCMPRIAGRSAFLSLLKDEGVTHLFGNPGTTELPIMHALKDHPELTFVMAMQESLVVAMADGYARSSGRLVACNVHVAPGLGNAMGSLYNAQFTGTPIILTAGQQEQGHGLMEPLLYGPLVRLAEPLVKWSVEVTRLEDLPRIMRRAAKVATTPPTGPVFISLPGDILNAEADIELMRSSRIESRVTPSDAALDPIMRLIEESQRPVIIVGDEIVKSDALDAAAAFATRLACPVYQQTIAYGAHFPSAHPCFMGALPRVPRQTRALLAGHDLVVVLGADPLRMSIYSPDEPI